MNEKPVVLVHGLIGNLNDTTILSCIGEHDVYALDLLGYVIGTHCGPASDLNEVWIVNLVDRQIEIYRNPDAARKAYSAPQVLKYGALPAPVALPGVSLRLEDVLPGS